MDALSEASGTFAIRILKTLCQEDPSRNIFYSPMSISSALAMVLLGAKGSTAAQIAQVLSSSKTKDIHQDFQLLLTEVNKPGTQYSLRSVNRLFGEKSYEFLLTFKESCLKFYGAELEQLCFETAAEKSRKHINAWVSKQTEGKIEELLSSGSIDDQSKLILVNAMYFKGRWEVPFDQTCTREMAFKVNQKEERPVQMMSQEATVNLAYVSEVQAQVLELPYAGQELSMLIVLPDDGVELSTVENTLTFEKLRAWTKPGFMKNIEAEIFLPRFKLEDDYDMQSVLQRLGVVDAFQQGLADFSGLSASTDLCVSRFVHKSVVEVNEEGTEAAAATAATVIPFCGCSLPMFCADHPFLFFIRHNKTNTLLFCGRFCSP